MPFQIIWTKKSKKDLKLIDKNNAKRIINKVQSLETKEIIFLEKMNDSPDFKLRVCKYRVIIEKFPATRKLFVLRVGHRKNIYKKMQ